MPYNQLISYQLFNVSFNQLIARIKQEISINDIMVLHAVSYWNDNNIQCGIKDLWLFFKGNARQRRFNQIHDSINLLVSINYLTKVKRRAFNGKINLRLTIEGQRVLNSFESLLSTSKLPEI